MCMEVIILHDLPSTAEENKHPSSKIYIKYKKYLTILFPFKESYAIHNLAWHNFVILQSGSKIFSYRILPIIENSHVRRDPYVIIFV